MGENSKIQWTHHTFNPWIGCTPVSAGCKNCYAEALMDIRYGRVRWGSGKPRLRTSDSYWRQPFKWNRNAARADTRMRVFCASLADVFDDEVSHEWRDELFGVIALTHHLDWLVLTKRPHRAKEYLTAPDLCDRVLRAAGSWRRKHGRQTDAAVALASTDRSLSHPKRWRQLWIGASVEDQKTADERLPVLLDTPAAVRFVSYEPALGPVKFGAYFDWTGESNADGFVRKRRGLDWIIVGGESGPRARPFEIAWARATIAQCKVAAVACFVKQLGSNVRVDLEPRGREETALGGRWILDGLAENWRFAGNDSKGGDWDEWPEDLHVREFPQAFAPTEALGCPSRDIAVSRTKGIDHELGSVQESAHGGSGGDRDARGRRCPAGRGDDALLS